MAEEHGCPKKRIRGSYCLAAWCSNFHGCRVDKPISFFTMPKEEWRVNAWLKFGLREDLLGKNLKNWRLCSEHFLPRDFKSTKPRVLLMPNAIPTVAQQLPKETGGVELQEAMEALEEGERELPETPLAAHESLIGGVELQEAMEALDEGERELPETPLAAHESLIGGVEPQEAMEALEEGERELPETPLAAPESFIEADTPRRWSAKSNPTPRTSRRLCANRRTIARLRTNLFRAKCKPKAGNSKVERENLVELGKKYLPKSSHNLFMAQLQLSKASKFGRRWSPYMKDFALSLFYHGPKAYRFLQKTLCLPSVRTLKNWQKEVIVKPGIDDNALAALEAHSKNLTESEKLVSLVVDEIALRESLYYDCSIDSIVGFCNYGGDVEPKVGNQCLVAMIKGINKQWKQCIGYWVTHKSTSADVLQNIVLECIGKVSSIGLKVKVLICDQGPHNVKLSNMLDITPEAPFFMVGGEKIYFMFDPPHLLKSIRNNLITYNFRFNGSLVKWSHLRNLFELTDPLKLKMIPKITKFHIDVKPFKKMRVKLASQVFSNSVSVAMSAFVAMGKLSGQAEYTASFFEFMDRLFDSFNSSQIKCHPFKYRYAMGEATPHIEFLEDAFRKLKSSSFVGCRRQPPCLNGWLISIRSLISIFLEMKDQYGISRLCTRVLNQDALENFFSLIRQQHGCNVNPTVMQFGKGYKHLLLTSLSKLSSASNCELDLENFLIRISQFLSKNSNKCSTDSAAEGVVNFSEINISEYLDEVDFKAIDKVAGYLCGVFIKQHKCAPCREAMVLQSSSEGHEGVVRDVGEYFPNERIVEAIREWEKLFMCTFMESLLKDHLCHYLKCILMLHDAYKYLQFPCASSRDIFLGLFVKARLKWGIRSLNETYLK